MSTLTKGTPALEAAIEKTAKAFGGCRKCYGKGYSTQKIGGKVRINTCVCDRGIQLDQLIGDIKDQQDRDTMALAKAVLPDYIEDEYPKGKSRERGAATVHIAAFLAYLKNCL